MDWSKYSALKSDSKASMAKEEKKAAVPAVKYKKGDSELRAAKAAVKYKKDDFYIPEGKKVGDVKEAAVEAVKIGDVKVPAVEAVEGVYLSQKRWNPDNGESMDDDKIELSLPALESEKARYDADMARAKAQSDGLKAAIADYKSKV